MGRQKPTALESGHFAAQSARRAPVIWPITASSRSASAFESILGEGEKAGASNKPGSVIDNHSSGTIVTDCL